MSKQNFDTAEQFLAAFEADVLKKVQELRDTGVLTQKSLVKLFESVAEQYRDSIPANGVFTSNFTGALYELVNITQQPITFSEKGRDQLFHPRILLWTGKASPAHTHPAEGNLAEGDVACVYYPVTPGAREVQYALEEDTTKGKVKTVEFLIPGSIGVDRHSKESDKLFAHQFVPADNAIDGLRVVSGDSTEVPVRTVTFNLYNAADVSKPAKGAPITDTQLETTTAALEYVQTNTDKFSSLVERFKLSRLAFAPKEQGGYKTITGLKPSTEEELSHLREQGTRDDRGFAYKFERKRVAGYGQVQRPGSQDYTGLSFEEREELKKLTKAELTL